MTQLHGTKYHLNEASYNAEVAVWTKDNYHIDKLRASLVAALSAAPAGEPDKVEWLYELIEDAISDTVDVDWTYRQAAERIVEVMLNACAPKFSEDEEQ